MWWRGQELGGGTTVDDPVGVGEAAAGPPGREAQDGVVRGELGTVVSTADNSLEGEV